LEIPHNTAQTRPRKTRDHDKDKGEKYERLAAPGKYGSGDSDLLKSEKSGLNPRVPAYNTRH
jgi:hypothetical protein